MNIVYARATSSVTLTDGSQVLVSEGTHWSADDAVVLQVPSLFSGDPRTGLQYTRKPAGFDDASPVEQATARPGEKRGAVHR